MHVSSIYLAPSWQVLLVGHASRPRERPQGGRTQMKVTGVEVTRNKGWDTGPVNQKEQTTLNEGLAR